ncbi:hypothetical protein LOZ86_20090 [Pectobacterium parvum]|uniref:NAD(+)--protein-arginine ADP-ribosyltransferase n=1 Tax=Pectobacterium parvum TaxID=2778550 RepID=A0AAP9IF23_9GAMM|nr:MULTISPECIES: hypothetical protein [Pectobacterium]QHQ23545.1 hypothetical protein GMX10_05245 [Pectobacterium parvum]UFK39143.1 hypothetical protein LOZ86_20090 [Pectobacterium parvum]UVD97252.1 hypothetical protein NV347_20045 [Pectobacterium parvum]
MSVDSIRYDSSVSICGIRQERAKLSKINSNLLKESSCIINRSVKIYNYIDAQKNHIKNNKLLIENLQSVSEKHGDNATVRLKNDRFKYGQASNFLKNMLHGGRYQAEREAAVKSINSKGSTVSAGEMIKTLQTRIDSASSEIHGLEIETGEYEKKIVSIEAEIYAVAREIDKLVKIEIDAKKADEKSLKARQNFSMIYQSCAGCKAINAEARYQFGNTPSGGKVCGSAVVEEYRRIHGYEIFSSGNKALKSVIKVNCSELSELVKTGAKEWYTPTQKNITTYRGQGMTQSGINALISRFNTDKRNKTETVYNLGQFLSTSRDISVASHFANCSKDDVKVIFKVQGNSSKGLCLPGGLAFDNYEGERLYSPLAHFKVTAVSSKTLSNTYDVTLEEVTKVDRALPLPY